MMNPFIQENHVFLFLKLLVIHTIFCFHIYMYSFHWAEEHPVATVVPNGEINSKKEAEDVELLERTYKSTERLRVQKVSDSTGVNHQVSNLFQGKLGDASFFVSWFREFMMRLYSSMKSQGNLSLVVAIIFLVILLMQVWLDNLLFFILR